MPPETFFDPVALERFKKEARQGMNGSMLVIGIPKMIVFGKPMFWGSSMLSDPHMIPWPPIEHAYVLFPRGSTVLGLSWIQFR